MTNTPLDDIQKLRVEIEKSIKSLDKEFKEVIESAKIEKDNPMAASTKKLSLDLHTMKLDQAARSLLQSIRKLKEMKICDNSYKPQRDEFEKIYPTFAEIARNEGFDDIAKSFEMVAKVEYSHALLLDKLAGLYKNGNLYKGKAMRVFRCTNCGHIEKLTEGWKTCPLCSLEQGYIMIDYSDVFEEASEA